MKTWITAIVLATTLIPSAGAQEAPTPIPLRVATPGETFSYRYTMQMTIEQQMGERVLDPQALNYRYHLAFTVRQVDPEGNAELVMSMTPGSVIVTDGTGDAMRQTVLTIPAAPGNSDVEGDAKTLADLSSAIGQAQVLFQVTPQGDVSGVNGLDRVMDLMQQFDTPDVRLLGPIAPGQIEQTLEFIFGAEGAAGTSRRIGSGWQTSRSIDVPPVAVLDFTDSVNLASIDGQIATMQTKTSVGVRRPTAEDAARPTLGVEHFAGTAATMWDLAAGRLQARSSEMSMATSWQLAEVNLLQKQSVSVSIERAE